MPTWLRFLLAALAVWRITHLIAREDGPFQVLAKLREWLGAGIFGTLMDCFKCLSVWVAVPFAFFVTGDWIERAVAWLALSGAAILLEERVAGPLLLEGGGDGLLRGEEDEGGAAEEGGRRLRGEQPPAGEGDVHR